MSESGAVLGGTRVGSYGADDAVLVDDLDGDDGIVVVTLNSAARHNVLDPPMMIALTSAFDAITARRTPDPNADEVRAVILRAAGRALSVGVDIGNLGDYFETGFGRDADPFAAIVACPFPVIGAVNGPAVTGGFEIALSCDVLVATADALFMDNHTKYGLHPVRGLTWRLATSLASTTPSWRRSRPTRSTAAQRSPGASSSGSPATCSRSTARRSRSHG